MPSRAWNCNPFLPGFSDPGATGVINLMVSSQGGIGRTRDNRLKHQGLRHNSRNDVRFPDNPWQEANVVCGSGARTPPTDLVAIEIQFVAIIIKS